MYTEESQYIWANRKNNVIWTYVPKNIYDIVGLFLETCCRPTQRLIFFNDAHIGKWYKILCKELKNNFLATGDNYQGIDCKKSIRKEFKKKD